MEQKTKSNRGGARPGAGRPVGSTSKVTVTGLLEAIDANAGESYVELLAQDFVHARANDRHLAQKYHHLILSKVAPTLNQVETVDTASDADTKLALFEEALKDMADIAKKRNKSK